MRHLWTIVALLGLLAPAGLAGDSDRWYELYLGDARAGWSRETVTTDGDRVTTRSEMEMTMGRAASAVTIRTVSEFVETADGEPVEVTVSQTMGDAPVEARYVFREDDVLMTSGSDGAGREVTLPKPEGEWLPPAAAGRFLGQRLRSGAESVTLRTLNPSDGLEVVTVDRTGIKGGRIEVLGREVECYLAESSTLVGPVRIRAREWLSAEGEILRSETSMGALQMTMMASTKERALREFEAVEVMVSTFVRPDRVIKGPRWKRRAVYRVELDSDELPGLAESAYQSVEVLGERAARVTVDLDKVQPAGEVDREVYLASTTYADAGDALIKELTERAIAGREGEADQAEALRRFVFRHIEDKNLGTAFATASETARSCKGDCSEHGVLLAAMLRAVGIPSRVAVGVVYVEQFAGEREVFGYHMWTQALLETASGPAWVDLDATLNERSAFDATHIAFATSALGEGDAVSSLAALAPMLGAVKIAVEEAK